MSSQDISAGLYPLSGLVPFVIVNLVVSALSVSLRCWARSISRKVGFRYVCQISLDAVHIGVNHESVSMTIWQLLLSYGFEISWIVYDKFKNVC